MKKAIAMAVMGVMILQIFSIVATPVSAEIYDDFFDGKLDGIVKGEIIVKFKTGTEDNEIFKINSKHGASVVPRNKFAGFHRLKIPKGKTVSEMIEIYKNNPYVEYAEPNYIAHACMTPNDQYYNYQWHLHGLDEGGINMEPAWDISTGSGVTVAVIDTGIKAGSDLADTCIVDGYDFVNNDNDPIDDNNHGTHVAGTIAQSTNNNVGVCGVAFNACLMPVKVLNSQGSGTYSDVADGIYFAVDNGANIISMSLGGGSNSQALGDACEYAYNNGVTVIAASGNDGQNGVSYPASYDDYVIAVGATQYDKTRAPYSNYGSSLDVVAPGGNLDVDQNGDGYADGVLQQTFSGSSWGYYFFQGTSMATPHVSGVAALLYSTGVISPDEIRNVLQSTAVDLGSSGWDIYYGYGLINAYDALQYTPGNNPPTCSITLPVDGATVSGTVNIEASASDDVGVEQVDFYIDSSYLGSDTNEPYSWSWDSTTVDDGNHAITATAIDTASKSSSDSISVVVDNVNDVAEFFDSFEEDEWNGLWVENSQNDWFRSTQRTTDGSHSAEVDGPAQDATLTLADPIDLSDKSGATLTYSWYIERSWGRGEYLALDVFDGTWQEIKRLSGNVDPENVWHHETVDLSDHMVSGFKIRFRAKVGWNIADGNVDNVKIVSVDGSPNNPPVADDQSLTTDEDTSISITLTAADPDGDSLTYIIVDYPLHGTLSGTAPSVTFTPDADYFGTDSLTFKANDGDVDSNTAIVSITITSVNDAPVADDQSVSTDEDTSVDITLTASDVDGDSLTYSIVNDPSHGTLSGEPPIVTYTPDNGYTGGDSFTFTANDGELNSKTATVSVTVTEVNHLPVADDQSLTTDEDTSISITLTAADPDGDSLTYIIVDYPLYGTLSGAAPNVIYTPDSNYHGSDCFTFKANDGQIDSNRATITITITPVNDPPIADDQTITTTEDTLIDITLSASDIEGDQLTYSIISGPSYGTLSGIEPYLTYTPDNGYTGEDSFTFTANDGELDSNIATVTITVNPDSPTLHVNNIEMSTETSNYWWWWTRTRALATVTIVDSGNNLVEDATVSGPWSGSTSNSDSGTTNSDGKVTLYSNWVWSAQATFTFTVENVEKSGWIYDESANIETSDSITV